MKPRRGPAGQARPAAAARQNRSPQPRLLDQVAELLETLLRFEAPADALVSAHFRAHRQLGPRERHAVAETVYAVLRELNRYRAAARGNRATEVRRMALLAWQGDRERLAASLSEAERNWLGQATSALADASSADPALRHNLPPWLAERLAAETGDAFDALAASLLQPAPLDLRVNVLRSDRDAVMHALAEAGIAARPTPYSPWGLRVDGKPALQKLSVFTEGQVEVQDEGSQLLALLTGARRGEMVVDFCAGAGGKTLALGAMMRSTGRLYAFDVSGHRLAALAPRVARAGLSNVHTVAIAHERDERIKRLAGKIDRVLIDAPCSGLGTLRRNPDLKWRQSPRDLEELVAKQAAILANAARLLKPGGLLVYATCSLLQAENEGQAERFTSEHRDFRPVDAAELLAAQGVAQAASLTHGGRLRLWPHVHQTDGFFAAAWRRD